MLHSLFSSEYVSRGHPDKVADQISDAILDECLKVDADAKVACEVMLSKGKVFLGGEITTTATLDYHKIVSQVIREIGYDDASLGFDCNTFDLIVSINEQSSDIAQGVLEGEGLHEQQGAGDQGMMFGFACNESPELMPLALILSRQIIYELDLLRRSTVLPYLRPDAKSQITVEYDDDQNIVRVHTIVVSTQHSPDVSHDVIVKDVKSVLHRLIPAHLLDDSTRYFINPTGRFVIGGPAADCGLTGRKIIVDTYGGMARHGGGCFSGKDPSKVDRSASYAARYVAKTIVAAGLADRCEVQLAYAIGVSQPVSIKVETFGTSALNEVAITHAIPHVFDLTPKGIITMLDLKKPIYFETASKGHFGRLDENFPWERLDRVEALLSVLEKKRLLIESAV